MEYWKYFWLIKYWNILRWKQLDIVLQDFTHRDSITSLVAKMRICCFGSPTIFMVTNVRKCQTERVNIFWIYFAFILNSGSFFSCLQNFFKTKLKKKLPERRINSKYINSFSLAFSYICDYKTKTTNPHFSH